MLWHELWSANVFAVSGKRILYCLWQRLCFVISFLEKKGGYRAMFLLFCTERLISTHDHE